MYSILKTDKNGTVIKEGDFLTSYMIPFNGLIKAERKFGPVEVFEGNLIIRFCGSFLLTNYVENYCTVIRE
jgi:hypothetical protein